MIRTFAIAAALFQLAATAAAQSSPAGAPSNPERMSRDTPRTTTEGNTFVAPTGWTVVVRGSATVLQTPEDGSAIALVDVHAPSADSAVALAWRAYKPDAAWPLKVVNGMADKDGWTDRRAYTYQTSPNEKRDVGVNAQRAGGVWSVAIYDMGQDVGEKRLAQVSLIMGDLLPKGYTRESFAGKKAQRLTQARVAELGRFIETAMKETGVPGVGLGLIEDGKVIFAGGYGVRELGGTAKVDGNTRFMIASNTKAMTTLMLAKLVDERKLTWDTPVTTLLPSFRLGDSATTSQVRVKHLICACTGLPRQDFEWLFQFQGLTPERALGTLAGMQPTSRFGEMFQYSNPLAGAAGFIGGHVLYPDLELGAAYDSAMRTRVFGPLGMRATTFDYAAALHGDHAMPHSPDVDGRQSEAGMEVNYAIIPLRPAGAAWSNVHDMLAYVGMELATGTLPGGKRYVSRDALLARRAPQVPLGKDASYGMGLMVDRQYEVEVVHHGGDMVGFHSDMMWLPGHGVGAVVLTNGDPGWIVRDQFRRKLLEVLFDGRPEADKLVAARAKTFYEQLAAERKLLTIPAEAADAGKLAGRYHNEALGDIVVTRDGGKTVFDFGEWQSEVASRRNPDGTVSFLTTAPGLEGFEFVVGAGARRTLITRDSQHEYVFTES
ncbi:MAG TPA: serine hydrolase domain-containing protein [Gemmatimonadales bacterium]|nr:serine hydrolase domain-containing protein [Gemmatimonadales bacterium]